MTSSDKPVTNVSIDDGYSITKRNGDKLQPEEQFWVTHQEWLQSCGYLLPKRYRPGWTPSWYTSGKPKERSRDYYYPIWPGVMSAQRLKDGQTVILKKVSQSLHPSEVEISLMWSQEQLASNPKNHGIRIQEVLHSPLDSDLVFLVLPLLHRSNKPRFDTIGEGVDFFQQVFEGLQFMHENHVAHRDCHINNIMMDAPGMFPESFDHELNELLPDRSGYAKSLTRTQKPPRYYFVDFGISRKYDPNDSNPLEPPIWGGDRTAPEFQGDLHPVNPFPTDVYYIGNMIRENFLQGNPEIFIPAYRGFEFMWPLVNDMVQSDPSRRPNMDEVVARFEDIRRRLTTSHLRARPVLQGDTSFQSAHYAVSHVARRLGYALRHIPPVPRRKTG
ncbi:hypothetical protein AX16_006929 [Volvariella volvacea WC 439]|nr:hypothetical protein AX16_006929 [Volvariella volvacea WC 439]